LEKKRRPNAVKMGVGAEKVASGRKVVRPFHEKEEERGGNPPDQKRKKEEGEEKLTIHCVKQDQT